jgi:hypothetical protein
MDSLYHLYISCLWMHSTTWAFKIKKIVKLRRVYFPDKFLKDIKKPPY